MTFHSFTLCWQTPPEEPSAQEECVHTVSEFESTHCESDIWNPWDLSLPDKSVRGYPDWILEVWGRPTSGVDIEIKLGDREVS